MTSQQARRTYAVPRGTDRGPAREMGKPECGHWLVRKVKNGPRLPARIFWCDFEPGCPENKLDRWPIPFLAAEIAGEWVEVEAVWLRKGDAITEAEYRWRTADAAWAREHARHEPIANPDRPIDPLTVRLPV